MCLLKIHPRKTVVGLTVAPVYFKLRTSDSSGFTPRGYKHADLSTFLGAETTGEATLSFRCSSPQHVNTAAHCGYCSCSRRETPPPRSGFCSASDFHSRDASCVQVNRSVTWVGPPFRSAQRKQSDRGSASLPVNAFRTKRYITCSRWGLTWLSFIPFKTLRLFLLTK